MMPPTATQAIVKVSPEGEQAFLALRDHVVGLLKYAEARVVASTEDVLTATQD